ncbi:MAG: hypothetical protein A2Y93_12420 [Chloroflexi bacterium RBG_13_68_17]|nr:MAG: hypothetical protein A2Y93_12420 [Chloroflexi bacterium RBG_13_68_17]
MTGSRRRADPPARKRPLFEVRSSTIHGHGVFARRAIPTGTRIVEYLGKRISVEESEAPHDDKETDPAHVLLFAVDKRTLIDAGQGGNAARFINHSCDPNCEAVLDGRRVFIESTSDISPGEELTYDYHLSYEGAHTPQIVARYGCRCGAAECRGTMLDPRPRRTARPRRSGPRKAIPARRSARGRGKRA